jgi:hypothetical protein
VPPHVLCSATIAMEDAWLMGRLFGGMMSFGPGPGLSSSSDASTNGFGLGSSSSNGLGMNDMNVLGLGLGLGQTSHTRKRQSIELHLPSALTSIDKILKTYDEMRCSGSSTSSSPALNSPFPTSTSSPFALSPSHSSSTSMTMPINLVERSVDAGLVFSGLNPSNPLVPLSSLPSSSSSPGRDKLDLGWVNKI